MTTTNVPEVGERVTVRIGGQVHDLTVGEIVTDRSGKILFRSTSESDHIWTRMWISADCRVA